jgi:exodeoxyribonuclease VII large subunit
LDLLEQQRQATLENLVRLNPTVIQKDGDRYITRNSKLELPMVIQRIAVVSSKTSAGNEDFKHTLINNPYGYKFIIDDYHTVVQNVANAQQFLTKSNRCLLIQKFLMMQ